MAILKMSVSNIQVETEEIKEKTEPKGFRFPSPKPKQPEYIPGTDVTQEELKDFKKDYKRIFQSTYTGRIFIWHRLNRRTFAQVCEMVKGIEDMKKLVSLREKEIVKRCVLYPRKEMMLELAENPMVVSRIGQEILQRSGFAPLKKDGKGGNPV